MMYLGDKAVGIAQKPLNIANGIITLTEESETITINTGKDFTIFKLELKEPVMVSNRRNFGYVIIIFNGDNITQYYSLCSNAAGTAWSGATTWYKVSSAVPAVKNGTTITLNAPNIASGARFFAGIEYEWQCW